MRRHTWAAFGCVLVLSVVAMAAEKDAKKPAGNPATAVPAEAIGFIGTLEGKMVAIKPNGNTVTLTVTSATAAEDSKVKDTAALIGKDLTVKVRFEKKDGTWQGNSEDTALVKTLKKGDPIKLECKYIDAQKALGMTAPPAKVESK
jgi:hypothetical protein